MIIIGLFVSSLVFVSVLEREEKHLKQELDHAALNIAKDLEREVDTQVYALQSIATFFEASELVDRHEFYSLVTPFYKRSPSFQAIQWVPIVPASEKSRYEAVAQYDGFPGFRFFERDKNGEFIPVEKRDHYYPVFYLEPFQKNGIALGYDLGSETHRNTAIQNALKNKTTSASKAIYLMKGDHSKPVIMVLSPISKKLTDRDASRITGFVLGVIQINALIDRVSPRKYAASKALRNINITIFEENDDYSRTYISSRNYPKQAADIKNQAYEQTVRTIKTVKVADQSWRLIIYPNAYKYKISPNLKPFIASGMSLFFIFILAILMRAYLQKKQKAEEHLEEKTTSLSASEERFYAIIDSMAEGLVAIGVNGNIEIFNHAAESIFDYNTQEVIGKQASLLVPSAAELLTSSPSDVLTKNQLDQFIGVTREAEGLKKNGASITLSVSITEVSIKGKSLFVGMIKDITEQKNLTLMKSELIRTANHNLRAPLTSIKGALSIIKNNTSELSGKTLRTLATINTNSTRLGELIAGILDMEKLNTGVFSTPNEPITLSHIAKKGIAASEEFAKSVNVKLEYCSQLPDDLLTRGNEDHLLQLVEHLIINAIKHSPPETSITVETSSSDSAIRLTVFDKGKDITEALRPQLFTRFSSLEDTDSHGRGGCGLGLSIASIIVEQHQGKIDFYRTTDEETAFYFELPIYSGPRKSGDNTA